MSKFIIEYYAHIHPTAFFYETITRAMLVFDVSFELYSNLEMKRENAKTFYIL